MPVCPHSYQIPFCFVLAARVWSLACLHFIFPSRSVLASPILVVYETPRSCMVVLRTHLNILVLILLVADIGPTLCIFIVKPPAPSTQLPGDKLGHRAVTRLKVLSSTPRSLFFRVPSSLLLVNVCRITHLGPCTSRPSPVLRPVSFLLSSASLYTPFPSSRTHGRDVRRTFGIIDVP